MSLLRISIASSTFAPILVAYLNICLEIMNSFSFFSSMKRATIDNAKAYGYHNSSDGAVANKIAYGTSATGYTSIATPV